MNTVIVKNELAYWCRQGYDFIQPCPEFLAERTLKDSVKKHLDPQSFIQNNKAELAAYGKASGVSLRNIDAFTKLTRRKRRTINRYLAANSTLENDAIFWELHANRWWPELNTPTPLSRNRFAQSSAVVTQTNSDAEKPFAISGLTKPLPAPDDL